MAQNLPRWRAALPCSVSTNKQIRGSLNAMNANVLTVEDAARCLLDLVDRVHASGESALLLKSGKPVARIVSVPDGAGGSGALITFLRQWRIEHPEPDEQFGEAIDESRKITVYHSVAGTGETGSGEESTSSTC
jgi:antitoxin (DNA-binding transcriptional repressor) of toxin-antitoxin stability system